MKDVLDPARPLFLNDGTPVVCTSYSSTHVNVLIPDGHPARCGDGHHSQRVSAHRFSWVLTHNHAFYLTNKDPKTMSTTFSTGDRVEYIGDTTPEAKGKQGVVINDRYAAPDHSVVQLDGNTSAHSYANRNLKLIAEAVRTFKKGDRVEYTGDIVQYMKGWRGTVQEDQTPTNVRVLFDKSGKAQGFYPKSLTLVTPAAETRLRYGIAGGARLSPTVEEARINYPLALGRSKDQGLVEFTQEKIDGQWITVSALVVPPPQIEFYFYDMHMKLLDAEPTGQSHVRVEQHAGLVAKVEIVHP